MKTTTTATEVLQNSQLLDNKMTGWQKSLSKAKKVFGRSTARCSTAWQHMSEYHSSAVARWVLVSYLSCLW
ncbi:hypothetical protein BDZ91DRAFT_101067 [Kalaharituber pfeilii]|nr:hypothetical protein BDZ91DRAFT_101067 [Kalaharituber pfeilii]